MIKHTFAAFCISGFLSFGVGLPLAAQIETSPEVLNEDEQEAVTDDTEVIEGDDSLGLPGVGDFPEDGGLSGADGETAEGVIRLEIDGESTYYAPVELDETQFDTTDIPTYRLDSSTTTVDDGATVEEDGGMVTFPPADSVEDLEPEDILGE